MTATKPLYEIRMGLSSVVEIRKYIESLRDLDFQDMSSVFAAGAKLEELLLQVDSIQSEFPIAPDSSSIRRTQNLYEQFETNLEISFANDVLRNNAQLEEYKLYERFQRLIDAEVRLANIQTSDRVLFVGSGPLPISAILIANKTGAQVDCFDRSVEACETSRMIISKFGYSDQIRIIHQSAENIEISPDISAGTYGVYDVIVVALLAQPKEQILQQIWKSIDAETRVVIRYSEGNRHLIYEGIDLSAPILTTLYSLGERHSAGVDDTISTLVARIESQPRIFKI